MSPLPLRCYPQSTDNQILLQGGNGDKGFKNTCREISLIDTDTFCNKMVNYRHNNDESIMLFQENVVNLQSKFQLNKYLLWQQ